MSSTTQPGPTNQHFSVDPEGKQVVDLTFASEALGMPAANGYGWAQFEFGDQIGQDNRYTIARKLGWGMHSSTWLARDTIDDKFVAVKALTGHMTDMYKRAVIWEPDALRLASQLPTSPHCTQLLDEFTIPGKGTAGSHMCFVMPVYGGDVKALVEARTTTLPLPLAKRIALHLLRGIAHAHGRGIVHTDLKHDNIFFSTTMSADDIEAWMTKEPSRRHAPEASHDGVVQAAVSQPLPIISEDEAMRATYLLADFGCAQPSGLHANRTITSLPLRPPEVFLEAEWDKPADIWTFGCLIFELVTSKHLFRYQRNQKFGLDEMENMLYQMMLHTEEDFRAAQLQVSSKAPEYFNTNCKHLS
ncbi:Serine/threonine-protein kinase SRPK [Leucoagaricus sp. SymC.cos]|nr:Serine/threonine-protein kinase SRPK [Leucoagaricus sp. SymC.cos]